MEMPTASTARADLDDDMELGSGDCTIWGWAKPCMITYACGTERVLSRGAVLMEPLLRDGPRPHPRCTGLVGGSQSGQNTTSRPRTGREVVLLPQILN